MSLTKSWNVKTYKQVVNVTKIFLKTLLNTKFKNKIKNNNTQHAPKAHTFDIRWVGCWLGYHPSWYSQGIQRELGWTPLKLGLIPTKIVLDLGLESNNSSPPTIHPSWSAGGCWFQPAPHVKLIVRSSGSTGNMSKFILNLISLESSNLSALLFTVHGSPKAKVDN